MRVGVGSPIGFADRHGVVELRGRVIIEAQVVVKVTGLVPQMKIFFGCSIDSRSSIDKSRACGDRRNGTFRKNAGNFMNDPKAPKPDLTGNELSIMEAIWEGKRTTREIYDTLPAVNQKRITFSTISTYLLRMVQKKFLDREMNAAGEYEYTALLSQKETAKHMLSKLRQVQKNEGVLLKQFADTSKASEDDLNKLKEVADSIERNQK